MQAKEPRDATILSNRHRGRYVLKGEDSRAAIHPVSASPCTVSLHFCKFLDGLPVVHPPYSSSHILSFSSSPTDRNADARIQSPVPFPRRRGMLYMRRSPVLFPLLSSLRRYIRKANTDPRSSTALLCKGDLRKLHCKEREIRALLPVLPDLNHSLRAATRSA